MPISRAGLDGTWFTNAHQRHAANFPGSMAPRRTLLAAALSCRRLHISLIMVVTPLVMILVVFTPLPLRRAAQTRSHPAAGDAWSELRSTNCDGYPIPREASIGTYKGRIVPLLRTLTNRNYLSYLANQLNLTDRAVEVHATRTCAHVSHAPHTFGCQTHGSLSSSQLGVFRGEFAEINLKQWKGRMYTMVDMWTPSDCVGGNSSFCVYPNESRSYDLMATEARMRVHA